MSLETLISAYGYPAILIGSLLEGETIVLIGGFAAHRGYLSLPVVILCAFVGTVVSDQFFFHLGLTKGKRLVLNRPRWTARARKIQKLLDRYHALVILGFRFLYGVRNVTPFVIGATGFPRGRFLTLNLIGALIWSVAVASAGYLFGHAIEAVLADVKKYELLILALLMGAGMVAWLVVVIVRQRRGPDN